MAGQNPEEFIQLDTQVVGEFVNSLSDKMRGLGLEVIDPIDNEDLFRPHDIQEQFGLMLRGAGVVANSERPNHRIMLKYHAQALKRHVSSPDLVAVNIFPTFYTFQQETADRQTAADYNVRMTEMISALPLPEEGKDHLTHNGLPMRVKPILPIYINEGLMTSNAILGQIDTLTGQVNKREGSSFWCYNDKIIPSKVIGALRFVVQHVSKAKVAVAKHDFEGNLEPDAQRIYNEQMLGIS